MTESTARFIYRDSRGRITARSIFGASESDEYLQGVCGSAEELRTFRKDRILEYIADDVDLEQRMQHHVAANPPPKEIVRRGPRKQNIDNRAEVCFTGFNKERKSELQSLAESAGMFIRTSVTRKLDFLCYGLTAGPAKISKARSQGVVALAEHQFLALIETGEVLDDD